MDGWNLPIKVTGFPQKSSAMPSGSTIGSHSAFAMSKTCLLSAVSPSHTRRFDAGASSLGRPIPDLCAGNRDGLGTSGTSMKCSSRSEASATTCGGRWIRMGTSLIFWSRSAETVEPLNDSFVRALKHQGQVPWQLVTDKLRTYRAAHREVFPSVMHRTGRYENNRAEVSHQHTREQEKQMRRFKSPQQAQRFLSMHGLIQNLFRFGRHHLKSVHYRLLRVRALSEWRESTCAF